MQTQYTRTVVYLSIITKLFLKIIIFKNFHIF